jgi:glutamyl-tRNA synthetase
MKNVVTRFAPSPTGYFHAGSYRTALFSCLFARQNGGKFILRIEDTDKERSKKEYEENIIESLNWLGLKYDEFYRQSDRTEIYAKYIKQLIDSGHAYVSKENVNNETESKNNISSSTDQSTTNNSKKRDGTAPLRSEVIRFKNPNRKVAFDDMIRGRVEFDTTELGDFVIAKSIDEPVFHLVVVIDDMDMGMTHIIRGEDHISNTPRQILIYEALGAVPPTYAHIPLLLSKDRAKLSKRDGGIPIYEYRSKGYLPEAIVNYLALLGWHPSDDREIFTFDELVKAFNLAKVQKGGAIFDETKLAWFNKQYIVKLSDEEFLSHAAPFFPEWLNSGSQLAKNVIPLLRDKISSFGEITQLFVSTNDLAFIKDLADYDAKNLVWKKENDPSIVPAHLTKCLEIISNISSGDFTTEIIKSKIDEYCLAKGKGNVLWPLRMALTGQDKSPDPYISAFILGKEESLKRIKHAIDKLS